MITNNNQAKYRNKFPDGLRELHIDTTWTSLPPLPSTLENLTCPHNEITWLPPLPSTLQQLWCSNNQLTSLPPLPPLPSTLQQLWCSNNQVTSLPPLPPTLEKLHCDDNQLTSLPPLPSTLEELSCDNNQLTSLPPLPATLKELYCPNNQLTSLPPLPSTLQLLSCRNNPLVWGAQKDVPRVSLNEKNNAKLLQYSCYVMSNKAIVAFFVEHKKLDVWIDKPITDDGRMGIAVRHGMRLFANVEIPKPFKVSQTNDGVWRWENAAFDEALVLTPL